MLTSLVLSVALISAFEDSIKSSKELVARAIKRIRDRFIRMQVVSINTMSRIECYNLY